MYSMALVRFLVGVMIHPFFHLQFMPVTTYEPSDILLATLRIHPHTSQIFPTPLQPFTTPYTLPECHHVPHISLIHGHATPSNIYSPYQCTKLPYLYSYAWMHLTSDACDLPSTWVAALAKLTSQCIAPPLSS